MLHIADRCAVCTRLIRMSNQQANFFDLFFSKRIIHIKQLPMKKAR